MKKQLQLKTIKSIFKMGLSLAILLFSSIAMAQTVLINPSGDGGFNSGNTFAANGWTVSNSTNNPWVLDTANGFSTIPISGRAAYIRDTGTTSAFYDISKTCVNYFYRNISVPAGESKIVLTFNWMQQGETNWDMWQIFISDTNIVPTGSTTYPGSGTSNVPAGISGAVYVANGAPSTGVQTATLLLPASLAGTTFRLIFAWKSDASAGSQPPAIIDNISLTSQVPTITSAGGIFTINNLLPTSGTNYNNFSDAIFDLNVLTGQTITNPVIFNVTSGQTFLGNLPEVLASGNENNRIIFRRFGSGPNPIVSPTGTTATTDYGIGIGGADYVTFDGIDVVASTNAVEYGYRIRNITANDGAKHIIVRNARITLDSTNTNSIGLIHTTSTVGGGFTAASAAGQNDSCQYHDLTITNCGLGGMFITSGSATFWGNFNRVWNVTIGTEFTGMPTGNIGGLTTAATYGIQFNNQANFQLYNSIVRNIVSSGLKRGIYVLNGRGDDNRIYNNRVYGIHNHLNTSTNSGRGIDVSMSTTTGPTQSIHVFNNEVSGITTAYNGTASATRLIVGILNGTGNATTTINITNNTVVIDGSGSLNASNVCMEWGGSTAIYNVRNNNFVNLTGAQSGVAKHYILRTTSATSVGASTSIVNNNNYFLSNQTNGFIALLNATDAATLATYRTSITTPTSIETNTFTANPVFVNMANRNFTPQSDTLDNNGLPVAGVTFDINNNPRSLTTPDRGSIEFTLAVPNATTVSVTAITQNSATLNGSVATALPGVTESGFVYSTNPNPVIGGPGVIAVQTSPMVSSGNFSLNITGLLTGTTYFYRAYATNAKGTGYGVQQSFTTSFAYPYVENFDGNWTPNSNGWNHTRFFYTGDGTPAPIDNPGPKDWRQNKNTGLGIWTQQSFATNPNAAVSDSGALWIEDYYFATTNGASNLNYSRVETPGIDLSTSTNPYVRFYYYANQSANNTYPLILMASSDNGITWRPIMHIQPNAAVSTTSTSGPGTMLSSTPWQRITVRVPDAFKVANAKFAFYRNAAYSFSGNLFIDSLYIAEFTPTTITSAQTGNWSNPTTWVGGVVPNADNNVVIATGHTVTSDVNIARMQDLTINGTFIFFSSSTLQVPQIFGNLTINSGGTFNAGTSGSSAISRWVYLGGSLTNAGTLNMGTSTAHSIFFTGGSPATVTNTGTITNGYISQVHFANSGGITFNATSTSNIVIRNTVNMIVGDVTPNGRLTLGLSSNAITILRGTPQARFTARPLYPNLNTSLRSVTYGGGVNGNFQMAVLSRDTIYPGNETDSLAGGIDFIRGTLTLNTNHHVRLLRPLQVGDTLNRTTTASSTTGVGGSITFSRGILFTDNQNILTVGPNSTGSTASIPSFNTVNPPTLHGSYIIGPVRFVRPQSGTLTSSISVPFGLGGNYLGDPIINNVRRYMTINAGGGWAGQILQCELLPTQAGSINPPQTSLIGRNIFRVQVLENRVLPATSTILLSTYDEAGKGNRDILYGNQDQLFVMQAANINGPWTVRSVASGTGVFAQNTLYTRTTSATAPGPVSGNGEFFSFGTSAPLMQLADGAVLRNTSGIATGATNMEMLRIRVNVNGVVPQNVTALNISTTGSTNPASIAAAKVFYTGNDSNFNTNNQFGSTIINPSGNFAITGNQQLQNGNNFFWVAYDVAQSATIGQLLVANLNNVVYADTARVLAVIPLTGGRTVSSPMTFVSANAFHQDLTRVEQNSTNNMILRLEVEMSTTGASIPVSSFTFNTNGSANPAANISNARVFYSGSNPVMTINNPVGFFNGPNGTFTINGTANLNNGMNYFWLAYDIPNSAIVGDSVDAEFTSVTIGNIVRTVTQQAPIGARQIRAPYCASNATTTADGEILNVTVGSLNNTSTCTTTGGTGSALNQYSNYTSIIPPTTLIAGSIVPFSIHAATCGGNYDGVVGIWIDYNQDGDFLDSGETVHMSPVFTYGLNVFRTGNFQVPCNAMPGNTRMRVALIETTSSPISPCGTYGFGETEDYTVNIVSSPPTFMATNAIQQVAQVGAGSNNVPILRVPVKVISTLCVPGTITKLNFNTAGTTNTGDIVAAKLYRTGSANTFNTSNLVGTVASPSGSFSFTLADTTINDTNNYWLAYDVAGTASNNNLLDARFDSVEVFGLWRTPINGNPAGAVTVTVPMTYLGSSAIHPTLAQIERGTSNNQMLRIMVRTSSTGAPISVSQFDLATTNSANIVANVDSIRVWFTGNNPNFSATNLFGATGPQTAPFSITGFQNLLNDTNYFWVTYNVRSTANVGDSLDAEVTGITVNSVLQVPSNGSPIGQRFIRAPYCASGATSAFDSDIGSFILTSGSDTLLNNTVGCGANVVGANGTYSNFTSTVINVVKGSTINFSLCYASSGILYNSGAAIYIDYNNNGLWETGEMVWTASAQFTGTQIGSFTIPCNVITGQTRLRVVLIEGSLLTLTNACGTFTWGETEDYTINFLDATPTPIAANTIQQTGSTFAGATNVPILRVPVKVLSSPCNPGILNELRFNTIGTTNTADILAAKLYKTSGSTFNSNNLLGTIPSPSGPFTFLIADTAVNDTNNYWLAYDVSGTAPNNNVLDARFDSANVFGVWLKPTISAPAGNVLIATPMSFITANANHPTLAKIERGTQNNKILRVMVRMSSTGAPVALTQLNLSTNGSINTLTNIDSIIVWTTGSNPNFVSPIFFGSTGTQNGPFNINGSRNLLNDTNYFWVTYNVPGSANINDSLDAEIISMVIGGVTQVVTGGAPNGARYIRAPYCVSGATSNADSDIGQVTITSGSTTLLNNGIGCTPSNNNTLANGTYSNFTGLAPAVIPAGTIANLQICYVSSGFEYASQAAIYIDYNDNGLWDAGEMVWNSTVATQPNINNLHLGSFIIHGNAPLGIKRMRVVLIETTAPLTLANACGTFTWGETEDYLINITPQVANTYNWTATTAGLFNTATNWTPNRTIHNVGDRLRFASGGSRTVNEVLTNPVKAIEVSNNTQVTLNSSSNVWLSAVDTLYLTSGIVTTNNNVTLMTGSADTLSLSGGIIVHSSGGVNGLLGRWIRNTTGLYQFPLVMANGTNRTLTINYTSAPTARGTVIARFVPGIPGNAGLPLTDGFFTVNRAAEDGVFRLVNGNGLTGGTYDLTFRADSFKGVLNVGGLTVIRRVDNTTSWTNPGTFVFASGTNAQPLMARDGLSVYGEFTIGGDTLSNPLPVSLIRFTANKLNDDVMLNWVTSNEVNNSGFDVERSIDGVSFEPIAFIKGNGNTNHVVRYNHKDQNAFDKTGVNTLYYRLRQFDFDGSYNYSNVVSVNNYEPNEDKLNAYPNPFNNDVQLEIFSTKDLSAELVITDIQGRMIATRKYNINNGLNVVNIFELNDAKAGVYFVKVNGMDIPSIKIVKAN
ncbi:MAG: GEVED domain-containing protein [Bacteroidia bacterium]